VVGCQWKDERKDERRVAATAACRPVGRALLRCRLAFRLIRPCTGRHTEQRRGTMMRHFNMAMTPCSRRVCEHWWHRVVECHLRLSTTLNVSPVYT